MADLKGRALPDVALVATRAPSVPSGQLPQQAVGAHYSVVQPRSTNLLGELSEGLRGPPSTINLSRMPGYTITFIYPWTGREGHDNPHDWDNIIGAHGSTPQALAFNKLLPQFAELGSRVFGLSGMRSSWQKDFANKNLLQFPLLSDEQEAFANALSLNWLRAGARAFLARRTLIGHNGLIIMDRQTIPHPEDDAGQTLALLRVLMKT